MWAWESPTRTNINFKKFTSITIDGDKAKEGNPVNAFELFLHMLESLSMRELR